MACTLNFERNKSWQVKNLSRSLQLPWTLRFAGSRPMPLFRHEISSAHRRILRSINLSLYPPACLPACLPDLCIYIYQYLRLKLYLQEHRTPMCESCFVWLVSSPAIFLMRELAAVVVFGIQTTLRLTRSVPRLQRLL